MGGIDLTETAVDLDLEIETEIDPGIETERKEPDLAETDQDPKIFLSNSQIYKKS